MKANMRLQTRMGRHLIMTPQLQQAIKLLQMSRVEMEQLVEQSLLENPVLEENESSEDNVSSLENSRSEEEQSLSGEEEILRDTDSKLTFIKEVLLENKNPTLDNYEKNQLQQRNISGLADKFLPF